MLREIEIDQVVPESLISELVGDSIGYARMLARAGKANAAFVRAETLKSLGLKVDMLGYWVRGTDSFDRSDYYGEYKELFERHGLPRLGR